MFNVSYNPPRGDSQFVAGDASQSTGSYLWMGGPGITASTHYDRSHNFFTQIVGKKRFYLWAPSQLTALHIHPFYHPRDRQSQLISLEWGEGQAHVYDSEGREPTFVVDLDMGDVLYLPPFWAHRVTSLTPSISVNMWSPGQELHIGISLNAAGLPLGIEGILNTGGKDRMKRRHASGIAAVFVRQVIATTLKTFEKNKKNHLGSSNSNDRGNAAVYFAQEIYNSRYAPMGDLWSGCLHFESDRCPRTVGMSEKERISTMSKAKDISKMFQPLLEVPHGLDVAKMLLGDYLERLATFVAGVEGSCRYLRCVGTKHAFRVVAPIV